MILGYEREWDMIPEGRGMDITHKKGSVAYKMIWILCLF